MPQAIDYNGEMERIIETECAREPVPRLLLHVCCAPCSSHCLELLREHFNVTVYYYNPNLTEREEYERRRTEELRLLALYNRQIETGCFDGMRSTAAARRVGYLEAPYDPETYLAAARGLEEAPEGGARCMRCFALRLGKTAQAARDGGYDFFTTTLTISPQKNAAALNGIGANMAARCGVRLLPSEFKKKDGYKRSAELSARFGLYRQSYCGCKFSKAEKERKLKNAETGSKQTQTTGETR